MCVQLALLLIVFSGHSKLSAYCIHVCTCVCAIEVFELANMEVNVNKALH